MNKLVEKELEKDLETKINEADFKKRQEGFEKELQKISEKYSIGVQAVSAVQMIDLKN